MEKKSSTKDVDKGTDELEYMKNVAFTIHRKGLDKFEGQTKGSTGWFKLDSGFFFNLKFIQNSIKNFLKMILKIKTRNCIKRLLYSLMNNILKNICKKWTKLD